MKIYVCDRCGNPKEGNWVCPHCYTTGSHIANTDDLKRLKLEREWMQRIDNHQNRHEEHRETMIQRMTSELEALRNTQAKAQNNK